MHTIMQALRRGEAHVAAWGARGTRPTGLDHIPLNNIKKKLGSCEVVDGGSLGLHRHCMVNLERVVREDEASTWQAYSRSDCQSKS